ncbi:hypothetical protein [Streptomyces atratus]|uniref:hypothetical protein n=1 Tax=Streptomyces atratus TaxID=1893 RepID=UPI00340ED4F4
MAGPHARRLGPGLAHGGTETASAFAVALTGYWTWHHAHGPGGALGACRGRAAEAGRQWIGHRLA